MFRARRFFAVIFLVALTSAPISGTQGPVARAFAGFNETTGEPTSSYTLFIGPADDGIFWTLSGATSHDPDGDPLSYQWTCEDRLVVLGVAKDQPDLRAKWPAGEHVCTLTVSDGFSTDSATVTLRVKVDAQPPEVTAPDDVIVAATESAGARSGDSSKLSAWLSDATAVDNTGGSPLSLPPLVNGVPVGPDTLFPLNVKTTVTFRFKDSYDNVGEDTADVTVKDIRHGDIFLTTTRVTGFGTNAGVIKRVRGDVAEVFCESPVNNPNNAAFWGRPQFIIVDSGGRVVFIATMNSGNSNFPHRALMACDFKGDPGKVLALYPGWTIPAGKPVHYPDVMFGSVNGLHLETVKTTVIDDGRNNGLPQTITQEAYVFSAHTNNRASQEFTGSKAFRYLTQTGTTEDGPAIVPMSSPPPDMTNVYGDTYSASEFMIGRTGHALRVDISGSVLGVDFGLRFRLGPSIRMIGEAGRTDTEFFLSDDRNRPDFPTECKAGGEVSSAMPSPKGGPHGLFSGIDNIVWDERFHGMVLTSNAAGYPRYMTAVEEFILDDNPLNDGLNKFTRYELNCKIQQSIGYYQLPENVREAKDLVVGPDGIYGVYSGEEIIRIRPGAAEDESLYQGHAIGVAVWPPQQTAPSGTAIVVRINSPVNVMLIDQEGRRLGVDADGATVNDFGDAGMVSPSDTHPRVYLLRNPRAAGYSLRSVGTGDGPFAIQVYSTDLSQRQGHVITTQGMASPGALATHDFVLGTTGEPAFVNSPPVANAGSDVTVDATSPDGALVTLNATASTDPEGQMLQYRWSGPFGARTGAVIEATMPIGTHAVRLDVEDPFGGTASDVVVITVLGRMDVTPPVLTAARTPANALGWNNADVVVVFSCTDADSGIAKPPIGPITISGEGAGQSVSASCEDAAGNQSSLTVDGINIDWTAPVIAATRAPAANEFGWHNSDVTVGFSCSDALSGVDDATVSADRVLAVEGANQSASGSCRDRAGNEASTTVTGVNIDKTAPNVTGAADRLPNGAGWYNADVTVQFICDDILSGVGACDSAHHVIAGEGVNLSRSATAVDRAGNIATATVAGINIDKTAPAASCFTDVTTLWPPNHRLVPITAIVDITDNGSGAGTFLLTAIGNDEGAESSVDMPGWETGSPDTAGSLRATRAGSGDGRVYTLQYQAFDLADNTTICAARVLVPHDRRK